MDGVTGLGVFPLQRCKTVHLVRHAQGLHNVAGEKDHSAYRSPEFFDAQVTPLGWTQIDNLRKHVKTSGLSKKIELVVTSPLLRSTVRVYRIRVRPFRFYSPYMGVRLMGTMQTAVGVFGGESYIDGVDTPPLMVDNAGNSGRPAVSSSDCPPFISIEYCRERLGVNPCDHRKSISECQRLFPAIDFSLIEHDEDVLWTPDVRESNEDIAARGQKFFDWLLTRKEKEIAVVSHSAFMYETLQMLVGDCHTIIKEEICESFDNCEIRSLVFVDRS